MCCTIAIQSDNIAWRFNLKNFRFLPYVSDKTGTTQYKWHELGRGTARVPALRASAKPRSAQVLCRLLGTVVVEVGSDVSHCRAAHCSHFQE